MTQLLKFCIDCEHYVTRGLDAPLCGHRDSSKFINLVTGGEEFRTCEAMRFMRCGPEGKLFKEKGAA